MPLATTFGWSRAELSGAYALSLLVAGILGVPVGYLVDRYGARWLMTGGSALAGCALLGLSQISHLWQFYLYWSGGLGIAMALIFYPVTFTVITSWFVAERAKAFAVLTLLGGLASPPEQHDSGGTVSASFQEGSATARQALGSLRFWVLLLRFCRVLEKRN